jgi:phospholipid/cholesterol/gamma-HCH transport system substrate-binding protein
MDARTRGQLVRLGVFTILGIVVFAMLVFTFQPFERAIRGGINVVMHMSRAPEITKGTPVRYLGILAGEVTAVDYAPPQQGGVLIRIRLNPDARVRNDPVSRPYVDTKLVTGEAYIEFPAADPAAPLLKDGEEVQGTYRATAPDVIDQMARLGKTAESAIDDIRLLVREVRDEIHDVSGPVNAAAQNAARMLEYRPIDDPARPLKPGDRNLNTVAQRLDQTLEGINAIVANAKFRDDLQTGVANLRTASERLVVISEDAEVTLRRLRTVADRGETIALKVERSIDRADGVIQEAHGVLKQQNDNLTRVGQSLVAASERLSTVLARTEGLLRDIGDGKGVLGRILAEPLLYERLLKTVEEMNRTFTGTTFLVRELLEHPGDYIQYGRRGTSDEERVQRVDKGLGLKTPKGPDAVKG